MKSKRADKVEKSKRVDHMTLVIEQKLLKAILWVYIILCLVIAGLNYGYANHAKPENAAFIKWFWHFYENWIKTIFIVIGSFLTLKIIGRSKMTTMRKKNLIGFICAALIIHIVAPFLSGNSELYFFAMPLPWTTTPLQLFEPNSVFYLSRISTWGLNGVTIALVIYVCMSIIVFGGTILLGRRWQCSTICLFNGFVAEVFAPVIPLVGKKKKIKPRMLKFLMGVKWLFLGMSLFFTLYWIIFLAGVTMPWKFEFIASLEIYKYLTAELLMIMFFWVAFIGRGYCYYCPLGTVLGFLSSVADQKIDTDNTKCIQCGQCNSTCPMSIDIRIEAKKSMPVKSLRCVGCGHCVDACPTRTLSYSTRFLKFTSKIREERQTKI